ARRSQCTNNLKQVGLAIHNFHDSKRYLPGSTRPLASSTVRSGTFTFLLPFIEQKALWDQYDLSKNWSDATATATQPFGNIGITSLRIASYECPSSPKHGGQLDLN